MGILTDTIMWCRELNTDLQNVDDLINLYHWYWEVHIDC